MKKHQRTVNNMKTATINVYSFSELSPKAKARAIADHAEAFGFSSADDYLASLEKLAEHFGGKLADYSVCWDNSSYSSARFDMPETEPEEVDAKVAALGSYDPATLKGNGDCLLTGFCGDESAIDGVRLAYLRDGVRDLSELMEAGFRSWLKDAQADCADQSTDERFSETADANEWTFYSNGRIFSP